MTIIIVLVFAGQAVADVTFTSLPDLPSGTFNARAYAVSADGMTVVGRGTSTAGIEPVIWSAGNAVGLGAGGDATNTAAMSVANGAGVAYGVTNGNLVRWTTGNPPQTILSAAGSVATNWPLGSSADGSALAYGDASAARRWTTVGGSEFLLAGRAHGISDDGRWVAGRTSGGAPFLWGKDSDIGHEGSDWITLTGPGGAFVSGTGVDVSVDGSVVIGSLSSMPGADVFRWTSASGVIDLGTPAGTIRSFASACSADGNVIVGFASISGGPSSDTAIIWDAQNGMRTIKSMLEDEYGMDMSAWHLEGAMGVSADGRTIVGSGLGPQGTHAWMITIPEPASLALVGVALLRLLRRLR